MTNVTVIRTVAGTWFYRQPSFALFWARTGEDGGPILFALRPFEAGSTLRRVEKEGYRWAASEQDARRKADAFLPKRTQGLSNDETSFRQYLNFWARYVLAGFAHRQPAVNWYL